MGISPCYTPGGMSTQNRAGKPKASSVRHTRAIQRDRSKRPTVGPPDDKIQERLEQMIHPATYAQIAGYQALGLRERVLTLPVMVAFVLSLMWRHLGSVSEAVRTLRDTLDAKARADGRPS